MKVLLTGSEGMLGNDIRRVFSEVELICLSHSDLDITRLDDVVGTVRGLKPDYVINAAAFTDVDRCESEPETAYLVNGIGARNIAIACEELGCPIVQISTDYVFDGTKATPYDEWDRTNPVSAYGLSKLMGEQFVSTLTNRFYIVRTAWLYGKNGRNFVNTISRLLSEKDHLNVVNDQKGSPTYTVDLARALRGLPGKGYGMYHITNSGSCTWYEFALSIARKTGSRTPINPVTSEQFKRPAMRPANSVLGHTMLRLEGITEPRPWEEALDEYLR